MAYTVTVDEYRGTGNLGRWAAYRDAPAAASTDNPYALVQGVYGYGALASLADVDTYRLGYLLPGTYTLFFQAYQWDTGSTLAYAGSARLNLLDATGATVGQGSSSGSLSFSLTQAGDYAVQIAAQGAATQYRLGYSFSASVPDVAAKGTLSVTGSATEGQWLQASYTFSDDNGSTQAQPTFQWYRADPAAPSNWTAIAGATQNRYLAGASDVGKSLSYRLSFYDDLGYRQVLSSGLTASAVTAASAAYDLTPPAAPRWMASSGWHYTVNPRVTLTTSLGNIELELLPTAAPVTVDNWLAYVNSGFLDGLLYHRVIAGFMVQAGGFDANLVQQTATYAPVALESRNGLSHWRGTLAMARTPVADSATSQFFINLVDNLFLNYSSAASPGYAVFGKVVSGMDVVDRIGAVSTGTLNGMSDVPLTETQVYRARQTTPGLAYTRQPQIAVDGLEAGGRWEYSLDGGQSWLAGNANSLNLPEGHYAAQSIRIRQRDQAGNLSKSDAVVGNALVVDFTAPSLLSESPRIEKVQDHALGRIDLVFSESVARGAGVVSVTDAHGGQVARFDATSAEASINGSTMTLLSSALHAGESYQVHVQGNALTDLAGNPLSDSTLTLDVTLPTVLSGRVYEWKTHALLGGVGLAMHISSSPTQALAQTDAHGSYLAEIPQTAFHLQATRSLTSQDTAGVITAEDALAALKMAAGGNPNVDGVPVSPYQFIAADVNGDGRVTSADALAILKMALGRSDAPAAQWVFVDESQDFWREADQAWTTNRQSVHWDRQPSVDPTHNVTHNLVAVLLGDVNGSWAAPAGASDLDLLVPTYFQTLAQQTGAPLAQWGVLQA